MKYENKDTNDELQDVFDDIEKKIRRKRKKIQARKLYDTLEIVNNNNFYTHINKHSDNKQNNLSYDGIYGIDNNLIIHINFREFYNENKNSCNILKNDKFSNIEKINECDKFLYNEKINEFSKISTIEKINKCDKVSNNEKIFDHDKFSFGEKMTTTNNDFTPLNINQLNALPENEKIKYLNLINTNFLNQHKNKNLQTIVQLLQMEILKLQDIKITNFSYFLQNIEPYIKYKDLIYLTSIGLHLLILKFNNEIYEDDSNNKPNKYFIKLFYKITNKILYSINILDTIDNLYIEEIKKDFEIFKIKEYLKFYRLKFNLFKSENDTNKFVDINKFKDTNKYVEGINNFSDNTTKFNVENKKSKDTYKSIDKLTFKDTFNFIFNKNISILHTKNKSDHISNNLLYAKFLYYTKKYIDGFLLIKDIKNILKYKLMYKFNKKKCLNLLKDDLFTYKHFLFYISCIGESQDLYEKCLNKFNNSHTQLSFLRFAKFHGLFYEPTIVNEYLFYELYVINRKLNLKRDLIEKEDENYKRDLFKQDKNNIIKQLYNNWKNGNVKSDFKNCGNNESIYSNIYKNNINNFKVQNQCNLNKNKSNLQNFCNHNMNNSNVQNLHTSNNLTKQETYKYLSKLKKKLMKKNLPYDLLEQEMCYLENKQCKLTNKFYYLYIYKKLKKKYQEENIKVLIDLFKNSHNGDILIILYIFGFDKLYLEIVFGLYNVRKGMYWSRTRDIDDFYERLEKGKKLLEYDQNY